MGDLITEVDRRLLKGASVAASRAAMDKTGRIGIVTITSIFYIALFARSYEFMPENFSTDVARVLFHDRAAKRRGGGGGPALKRRRSA